MSLSLSFPTPTYSSSNKPSVVTLKSDLSAIETAFNALAASLYPVGIIVEFNVSTNPATLLGFGTWTAHGTGKVTVAIDATQTEFDTVDETGGEKTHTLTEAELPANAAQKWAGTHQSSSNQTSPLDFPGKYVGFQNSGSGSAHNNLQPYIVVYRWCRIG